MVWFNYVETFYQNRTKPYMKNMRHSSLDSNVGNKNAKFQVYDLHNKSSRDMYVQNKIVRKYIFICTLYYLRNCIILFSVS